MARKLSELSKTPAWATFIRRRWADGRLLNIAGEMWLFKSVPMGPVEDARSPELSAAVAAPLMDAFEELSTLAGPIRITRRQMAKAAFRDVQLLLTNTPDYFTPQPDSPLASYHLQRFPKMVVDRRVLLLGARLSPRLQQASFVSQVSEVVETFVSGGDPVENFTRDFRDVDAALTRAGLRTPSEAEMQMAAAWWNQGDQAACPLLVHADHLHVFTSVEASKAAARLAEDEDLGCEHWPNVPDSHTVSFATAREFDLPYVDSLTSAAHWASKLIASGATAVSVRGKVEPSAVTRDELRRMRRNYQSDIREQYAAGKLDRAEQEETYRMLAEVEGFYASDAATPTLIEASTVVAFTGRHPRSGYDPTEVGRFSGLKLSSMVNIQDRAMAEMMIGSNVRANPYLRDLPSQTLAFSGMPSLSNVGDESGALFGFTERDRQPAYLHPMAATDADTLPIFVAAGQTGAGKALALSTRVPVPVSARFPTGWAAVRDLRVGDQLFDRRHELCRVTQLSDIDPRPELFRLCADDGQTILADGNHQFVLAGLTTDKPQQTATVEALLAAARQFGPDSWSDLRELHTLVDELAPGVWPNTQAIYAALRMAEVQSRTSARRRTRSVRLPQLRKSDPALLFPAAPTLASWVAMWSNLSGSNARRWSKLSRCRMAAAERLAVELKEGEEATVPSLLRRMRAIDPAVGMIDASAMRRVARRAGIEPRHGRALTVLPAPASNTVQCSVLEYVTSEALMGLAFRAAQLAGVQPGLAADERVLSVREMRTAGLAELKVRRLGPADQVAQFAALAAQAGAVEVDGCFRFATLELLDAVRAQGVWARPEADGGFIADPARQFTVITSIVPVSPVELDFEAVRCLTVDSLDATFCVGGWLPTHNSVLMTWLADQFARLTTSRGERTPVVIFDPKRGSDFSRVVALSGGTTFSLDDLATADGVFDPIRFSREPRLGVEVAHSTLSSVNPWGTDADRRKWEAPLLEALRFGVNAGARSTMTALRIAEKAGLVPREMIRPIEQVASASPMFVAICGSNDEGGALSASEGITYIKVGENELNLPAPGTPESELTLPQKVTMQLVRNVVYGSMAALSGRQGVILLDEGWVFTSAGRAEMERVGRLARSMRVFPALFTQRITDALDAGLAGYISRGVILPITDEDEAVAACRLFGLEATPERLARITAKATMGDGSDDSAAPNWRSMRALRDPVTHEVLRGTVGIYADVNGRAVPTEITIPASFLRDVSTNRLDMEAREASDAARIAAEAAADAADAEDAPLPVLDPQQPQSAWEAGW